MSASAKPCSHGFWTPWMASVGGPVIMRKTYSLFVENSHPETRHQGVMFRSPRAFVWVTTTLRYEPCTQFINVSQRVLHIYWQFSAMSHAIHKIVSKKRCQSYFISRRSPHLGISKDSESCASAHRCLHYAYARLIARVTLNLVKEVYYCSGSNILLNCRSTYKYFFSRSTLSSFSQGRSTSVRPKWP